MSNTVLTSELLPGFKFMLDASTPAIYLGPGGHRSCESVPLMAGDTQVGSVEKLTMHSTDGCAVAWWYKREWFISSCEHLYREYPRAEWLSGWTPEAEIAVRTRAKYVNVEG